MSLFNYIDMYARVLQQEMEKGENMTIKIKYFYGLEDMEVEWNEVGDWIDLRAGETVELKKGEFKLIPLGVAMQLPVGYEAIVAPRSSTFKKWGVLQTNGIGIIDNSYCGDDDEWKFPALAVRDTIIHKGDRICQFRIQRKQPMFGFNRVERLDNENRGGFGSTGTV